MSAAPRVAALVLAAGLSRRMGEANKLLAEIAGAPVIARTVDALIASAARPVVVVTGHDAARVREALAGRALAFAHNPDPAAGLAASLRAGLAALPPGLDGVLVALGDMPFVQPAAIEALLAAFAASAGKICVPLHEGRRGNPVLWPERHFAALAALRGDVGGRALLESHAHEVRAVAVDDEGVLLDVDTPEALASVDRAPSRAQ